MLIKINGNVIQSDLNSLNNFNIASIPNWQEVKDFFAPMVDFFTWAKRITINIKEQGFWNWFGDQILWLCIELIKGIIHLNDLLFLIPAIILMIAYFLIGKNKTTKWIIPLWVAYFVTEVIKKVYF